MPRVPQPINQDSILGTGGNMPTPPAGAFGHEGGFAIARGLADLGRGIVINAKTREEMEKRNKEKDDELWLNGALSDYQRGLTDYEVNPENVNDPDYLNNYLGFADQRSQQIAENAPSAEAHARFQERARDVMDRRYGRAAGRSAQNEMANDINRLDEGWRSSLADYAALSVNDPEAAYDDLTLSLQFDTDAIISMYGEIAPDMATKMVAQRIQDTVLALADKSPKQAKNLILSNGAYLDETTRQVLMRKVDERQQAVSLLAKDDFDNAREEMILAAEREGTYNTIPLEDYQALYPGEKGEVAKRKDDRLIQAAVDSHSFLSTTTGLVPAEKQRLAQEYQDSLKSDEQLRAFNSIVAPALVRDAQLYSTDHVLWLTENNSELGALYEEWQQLEANAQAGEGVLPSKEVNPLQGIMPDTQQPASSGEAEAARQRYYEGLLRVQGAPTGDTPKPETYLNLPRSDQHLLSKDEANAFAAQINGAEIDTAIGTINALLEKYPTDALRAQVVEDLSTLPKDSIRPEFKIAFQNADQPWLPQFVGAIRNAGDLEKIGAVDRAEIASQIRSNATWSSFHRSILGSQGQRANEVAGYYDAIDIYARTMMAKGATPKVAVNEAISQILTSTMTPTEIPRPLEGTRGSKPWFQRTDDQKLWLPRTINGRVYNDEELEGLAQRIGDSLTNIDPARVDPGQFPWANGNTDQIRDHILDTGEFYPEPGGMAYRLRVENKAQGEMTDLRTKDGRFFRLRLDRLPWVAPAQPNWRSGIFDTREEFRRKHSLSAEQEEFNRKYNNGWEYVQ